MISIIIPTYNSSITLRRTLSSVIAQTFSFFECIVVDDRSNDDTYETFKSLVNGDSRFKYQSRTNNNLKGANICRNQGLFSSKFDLILFLDSDDILLPFCLEERIKKVNSNPINDAWIFNTGLVQNNSMELFTRYSKNPLKGFLMGNYPWQTMSPLWKKEFLIKVNGFNNHFPRLQDVELHSRALLTHGFKYSYFFFNKIDSLYYISTNPKLSEEKLIMRISGYIMFINEMLNTTLSLSDINALKRSYYLLIKESLLLKDNSSYKETFLLLQKGLNLTKLDLFRIKIFKIYFGKINSKLLFEICFFNLDNWICFFNKRFFNIYYRIFI